MEIGFKDVKEYTKDLIVIYVEDDKALRTETKDILDDFFKEVIICIDGQDGLDQYNLYKKSNGFYVDLIITDINMPKKSGIEMISDISDINSEQDIIVISAHNDSDKLMSLISLGISNFILKPIFIKQFLTVLFNTCKSIYLKKQQEEFLIEQSKMAIMGDMIDSVAHQWKQPLGVIKLASQGIGFMKKTNRLSDEDLVKDLSKIDHQVNHLLDTLDSFRSFMRPVDKKTLCNLKDVIEESLVILSDILVINNIDIEINADDDLQVQLVKNSFKHVIINLINNAKDAFISKELSNRKIIFHIYKNRENIILEVIDNAGGIDESILPKIFDKNFTTKSKGSGTGIGLYMSRVILDRIDAKIFVENKDSGVVFKIIF
jgi:signal transduction histidine kinase